MPLDDLENIKKAFLSVFKQERIRLKPEKIQELVTGVNLVLTGQRTGYLFDTVLLTYECMRELLQRLCVLKYPGISAIHDPDTEQNILINISRLKNFVIDAPEPFVLVPVDGPSPQILQPQDQRYKNLMDKLKFISNNIISNHVFNGSLDTATAGILLDYAFVYLVERSRTNCLGGLPLWLVEVWIKGETYEQICCSFSVPESLFSREQLLHIVNNKYLCDDGKTVYVKGPVTLETVAL